MTLVPQLAAGTAYWGPRKIGDFVGFIPSSLFPSLRSQATRVKPLITHCFLQLLVNPDTGKEGTMVRGGRSNNDFVVMTFHPRLERAKLW